MKDKIKHILQDMANTLEKKNKEYGASYKRHGLVGLLTRITDKINRATYVSRNQIIIYESLEDTIKDLACYCVLYLLEHQEKKEER